MGDVTSRVDVLVVKNNRFARNVFSTRNTMMPRNY